MTTADKIKHELQNIADPQKVQILSKFFKTAPGEYGHGDVFLGVIVPNQRKIAKKYAGIAHTNDLQELLNSFIHEHRLTALVILIEQFKKSDNTQKEDIFNFYLKNTQNINNWDLVDISAPHIVGACLLDKERLLLYDLARSDILWERRIAIVTTHWFIRAGDLRDTFKIAEILISDRHDLIHKAVGWMLREAGKRDEQRLIAFLKKHSAHMPSVMRRYACEKLQKNNY